MGGGRNAYQTWTGSWLARSGWETWGAAVSFGMTWQERQVGASLLAKLKKNCTSLHVTTSVLHRTRTCIDPDENEHSKPESVLNLRAELAPAAASLARSWLASR